jgi:hypothetical protein
MIVEGYALSLYCDNEEAHEALAQEHFNADTKTQCWRKARKRGWRFIGDGKVICPDCARSMKWK